MVSERPSLFVSSVRNGSLRLWFCIQERDGWTFCYRLIPRERRPVVAEVRIVPTPPDCVVRQGRGHEPEGLAVPPGEGLTATIVRDRFTLAEHIYEALPAAFKSLDVGLDDGFEVVTVATGEKALRFTETKAASAMAMLAESLGFNAGLEPAPGRRGPRADLPRAARIAADYVDAWKSGSRSPAADAAAIHKMTVGAVRATIRRARTRDGLMTRQATGRPGGQLTPRAEAILKEHGRR